MGRPSKYSPEVRDRAQPRSIQLQEEEPMNRTRTRREERVDHTIGIPADRP